MGERIQDGEETESYYCGFLGRRSRPGRDRNTARLTTARSCSKPTGTISRRSASPRANDLARRFWRIRAVLREYVLYAILVDELGLFVLAFFRIGVLHAVLDHVGVAVETSFSKLTKCPEAAESYQASRIFPAEHPSKTV